MSSLRSFRGLKGGMSLLTIGIAAWAAEGGKNPKNWADFGGGPDSSHYVALNQITKANVS